MESWERGRSKVRLTGDISVRMAARCYCVRSMRVWALRNAWRRVSRITVFRTLSNTACRSLSVSGYMVWRWAMKTSTITMNCLWTRCWRWRWASLIRKAPRAGGGSDSNRRPWTTFVFRPQHAQVDPTRLSQTLCRDFLVERRSLEGERWHFSASAIQLPYPVNTRDSLPANRCKYSRGTHQGGLDLDLQGAYSYRQNRILRANLKASSVGTFNQATPREVAL